MRTLLVTAIVLLFSARLGAIDTVPRPASLAHPQIDLTPARCDPAFTRLTTDHFTIMYQPQTGDVPQIADLLELAYQHFCSFFADKGFALQPPNDKLAWLCFARPEHFNSYAFSADGADLSWLSSYYSTKTNVVAIINPAEISPPQNRHSRARPVLDTAILAFYQLPAPPPDSARILHEAAHQLAFNTGLQKRSVMYPLWLSEGLATAFETALSPSPDSARSQRLLDMLQNNRLLPLDEFLTTTRLPSDPERQIDFYAQAAGFFLFLSEHHTADLKSYLAGLHKLPPGPRTKNTLRREFVTAFGPVDRLNKSWLPFLQTP